jgi:hypothetical protein
MQKGAPGEERPLEGYHALTLCGTIACACEFIAAGWRHESRASTSILYHRIGYVGPDRGTIDVALGPGRTARLGFAWRPKQFQHDETDR